MIKITVNQFAQLMSQVRGGDENAATELLRLYEPEIRREIRLRLSNPRLRRIVDSIDISQSVFGNFFVRASCGEFELQRPEQLLGLLIRMATNKVIDRHRRETSRKMDQVSERPVDEQNVPGKCSTASEVIAGKELLGRVRELLSPDEKKMASMRRDGMSWAEVAEEFGCTAEAARKKLSRACERALEQVDSEV